MDNINNRKLSWDIKMDGYNKSDVLLISEEENADLLPSNIEFKGQNRYWKLEDYYQRVIKGLGNMTLHKCKSTPPRIPTNGLDKIPSGFVFTGEDRHIMSRILLSFEECNAIITDYDHKLRSEVPSLSHLMNKIVVNIPESYSYRICDLNIGLLLFGDVNSNYISPYIDKYILDEVSVVTLCNFDGSEDWLLKSSPTVKSIEKNNELIREYFKSRYKDYIPIDKSHFINLYSKYRDAVFDWLRQDIDRADELYSKRLKGKSTIVYIDPDGRPSRINIARALADSINKYFNDYNSI